MQGFFSTEPGRTWAKTGEGVNPTGGEELEAMAKDLMAQPPEVIERMKTLLAK